MRTCEKSLVENHLELLQDEFDKLLEQDRQDDLARMYSLLSRIADGLVPLRQRFEVQVRKAGTLAAERIAGSNPDKVVRSFY